MSTGNNSGYWVSTEEIRTGMKSAVINKVVDESTATMLLEILLHNQEYIERK